MKYKYRAATFYRGGKNPFPGESARTGRLLRTQTTFHCEFFALTVNALASGDAKMANTRWKSLSVTRCHPS